MRGLCGIYIETTVQLKTRTESVGGRQVKRPKDEWTRVENIHEAVVSYSQYIKAVLSLSLKQQKAILYLDREKLSSRLSREIRFYLQVLKLLHL